jgi:polyisoprenoid-binding protein YceI
LNFAGFFTARGLPNGWLEEMNPMRKTLLLGLLAVLTLTGRPNAAPAGIDAALGSNVTVSSATLSISGTSTMHPYTVTTKALKVNAAVATAADAPGLLQPGALQTLELQIPVNTFTSDKDGLTKQMFKAMKADKHPTITFRLDSYTVEAASGGATVKPTGTLTVAGVERPIEMALEVKEQAGGLHVRGARELLMTDFGIKPPTMFMGMLKTDDKITIKFDFQLSLAAKAGN